MSRARSGQARDPNWRSGRYGPEHVKERQRRLTIKHTLTCPRCHHPVATISDRLLTLDHCDHCDGNGCALCRFTGYNDGLAHRTCNAVAAAVNTNHKRSGRRPLTRTQARALITRAHGSTLGW